MDGVGAVRAIEKPPGEWRFTVEAPEEVLHYLVERGSAALDGISLTVATLRAGSFDVAIIPHTLAATTLGTARVGDPLNLEADMIGRYVWKYMAALKGSGGVTMEKLMDEGFSGPGLNS